MSHQSAKKKKQSYTTLLIRNMRGLSGRGHSYATYVGAGRGLGIRGKQIMLRLAIPYHLYYRRTDHVTNAGVTNHSTSNHHTPHNQNHPQPPRRQ